MAMAVAGYVPQARGVSGWITPQQYAFCTSLELRTSSMCWSCCFVILILLCVKSVCRRATCAALDLSAEVCAHTMPVRAAMGSLLSNPYLVVGLEDVQLLHLHHIQHQVQSFQPVLHSTPISVPWLAASTHTPYC